MDFERQVSTFMRPKVKNILFFYNGGTSIFAWKMVGVLGSY